MFYVGMLSYVSVSLQGEGGGFRIQAIFEDTHAMVNTDAASLNMDMLQPFHVFNWLLTEGQQKDSQ